MRRLQRPLDPKAVQSANAAMMAETGGRQLTMGPEDAELRKKWTDAYLAAGGKLASGFNSKPVKDPVQICPVDNWVEVEYLYADDRLLNDKQTGVEGAIAIIKHNGAEIARAKLDSRGFAHIGGIPVDITEITYCFDDDPPPYEIFPEFKPHLQTVAPEPDYVDKAWKVLKILAEWKWNQTKRELEWIGGALAGDFNEDPDMGQIVVGSIITLIPIVDQVGDVRDIAAALKKLIWDKRYDEAGVWIDLVITVIGCIPELGTVIKGVAKAIKKSAKGLEIAKLLSKLNWVGKGNAFKFLEKMSADFPKYGKFAKDNINKILKDIQSKLEMVKKVASAKVSSKIDEVLESIREVQKRVSKKVDEVIEDLKKRLDDTLSDAEKAEKKGSTQQKNTTKQEKESLDESKPSPDAPKAGGTTPTGPKGGKPEGKRTQIGKKADAEETRSLTRENEAADKLADQGYKVEQNPKGQGTKNPDYKIEGEYFDCYSPKTSNARNIMDTVAGKVGSGQADRIVVNLADSDVALDTLRKQLAESPIPDLKELMVLTKDGKLIQLFP